MSFRGDLYIASEKGAMTSKPRPVLVVQGNAASAHNTVTICLVSTELSGRGLFRLTVAPSAMNGLDEVSEIQIDRLYSFRRVKLERRIGRLADDDMARVDQALRRWLSL